MARRFNSAEGVPAFRLYSWIGVDLATGLGSILVGMLLIASNFRTFGEPERARRAILLGSAGVTLAITAGLWIHSDSNLKLLFQAVQVGLAHAYLHRTQGVRIKAHRQAGGRMKSNWRAVGIGLLFALGLMALLFATGFVMSLVSPSVD